MDERTIAIVGRPNVGKSALFNRLAGKKISIVHDMPGVTRDRIVAECKLGKKPFTVIDTGGIGADVDALFTVQVRAEVDLAVETSALLLFVVDGQDGLTPLDMELASQLRKVAKPIVLVVNKVDHDKHQNHAADFARLGFTQVLSVSAEHDRGIGNLVESIEGRLPAVVERAGDVEADAHPMKIALVGRPNVGKSSLTNAILKDERTLVSPISGTTRDAIDIPYERNNKSYVLIDTAGIRARSKVSQSVEVFSVMRSESSIKRADLVCLVVDASAGITAMDKKIAGLIQEARRPCVVAVNKWDLVEDKTENKEALNTFIKDLEAELFFLNYAPMIMVSAQQETDITRLFKCFEKVRVTARQRIGTGPLNRLFEEAMTSHPPAMVMSRRFKVLYATQPEPPPHITLPLPEIVIFCNNGKLLEDSYRRFLESKIREVCPWTGLPLLLHFRSRVIGQKGARYGSGASSGSGSSAGPGPAKSVGKGAVKGPSKREGKGARRAEAKRPTRGANRGR